MAKISSQNTPQYLHFKEIAEIFEIREKSLRLLFSNKNPDYLTTFISYSDSEIFEELQYQIVEIERDACLNILASIEAKFRVDYAICCEKRDKEEISRRFRELFSEQQYRIPLEDGIFEEWKSENINNFLLSYLKGAFKYRHWLAHGRYWTLKAGRAKYDFYELYMLALEVNKLPLKTLE